MSHQVFLSFSSKDIKLAEKIYDRLGKNGISCWISSKNIPAGADYQECIVEAINQATIVVLIFSTNANSSKEITKELSLASNKILIPTRIEDVLPHGAFKYQLSNRQFIDLFDDFENQLDDLVDRVKSALNPESVSSAKPKKKRVNWKKLGMRLGLVAGLVAVGIGGLFAVRAYLNAQNGISGSPLSQTIGSASSSVSTPSTALTTDQNHSMVETAVLTSQKLAENSLPATTNQPNIAKPTNEISEKVKGIVSMLKYSEGYKRMTSLKSMQSTLPNNINSNEAEALLSGTDQNRADSIAFLAPYWHSPKSVDK